MSGKVVVLMGMDGSGKSTLSRALQAELHGRSIPTVARWATLRPVLMVPLIKLAKLLLVRSAPKTVNYEAHIQAKRSGMNKLRFAHSLYFGVMVLDYLPQVWWKVGLPSLLGRCVICDRYLHDLALDFAITVNGDTARMMRAVRFIEHLAPRAGHHYFVAVPVEVAMSRKDDVPSVAYLRERDYYYRALAIQLNMTELDGCLPPAENCARILRDLNLHNT